MPVTTYTNTLDNLISGAFPLVTKSITVLSGENVVRGTVMGKVTTGGKFRKSLSAETDGSQVPHSILVADVDASAGDAVGQVYLTGQFNKEKVVLGTGHTIASIEEGLRDLSIYLETVSKNS